MALVHTSGHGATDVTSPGNVNFDTLATNTIAFPGSEEALAVRSSDDCPPGSGPAQIWCVPLVTPPFVVCDAISVVAEFMVRDMARASCNATFVSALYLACIQPDLKPPGVTMAPTLNATHSRGWGELPLM
jgi:hypothetical protein